MKHNLLTPALAAMVSLAATATLTACDDDDDDDATASTTETTTDDTNYKYIVIATVDEADYILAVDSLTGGTVSTTGNGLETETGTYYAFKGTDYVFKLNYNQNSSGTGASFYLDDNGEPQEKYEYTFSRLTTYGTWGDYVVTASTGEGSSDLADADGNLPYVFLFNYLNANDGTYISEDGALAENFLSDYAPGEYIILSGIEEANGMIYTSAVPVGMSAYGVAAWPEAVLSEDHISTDAGGSGSGKYDAGVVPCTQYPDQCNIAIYTGDSFDDTPIIAHTDKIGYATGRYRATYYQMIWADDEGNIYVFSNGFGRSATDGDYYTATVGSLPSGVMRIKAGETEFDDSYYVALEDIYPYLPPYRTWHATEDYFLVQYYESLDYMLEKGVMASSGSSYAIFKGDEGTTMEITGIPDDATIQGKPFGEDGIMYIPVAESDGYPCIYYVDVTTGVATKGITVECDEIETSGKLAY